MTDLLSLCSLADEQAALALDFEARSLDLILRTAFMRLGLIVSQFEKRQLWKHVQSLDGLAHHSFNAWLNSSAPYSRSHCYAAKGIVEELAKDIPIPELLGINESNARVLQACSSDVRKSLAGAQAKTMSESDLISHIEQVFPDQHIESRRKMTLVPTASEYPIMDRAVEIAKREWGCTSRTESLAKICEDWLIQFEGEETA